MVRVVEDMSGLLNEFYWDAFLLILAVAAWTASHFFSKPKGAKGVAPHHGVPAQASAEEEIFSDPAKLSQLLLHASEKQRGRALDLYCRSRRHVNWSNVSQEDKHRIFFNLCMAAARLGRNEVVNGLLRDMEMLQIPRTLDLYTALLKMMTSKRLFNETLSLWKRMDRDRIKVTDRTVWSCLLFAAAEEGLLDFALFCYEELLKIGGLSDKDYCNVIRLRVSRQECCEAFALLEEMVGHGLLPDIVMFNTVFTMCCAGGKHLDLAERLFRGHMKTSEGCIDAITYNTFMKGCVQAKRLDQAFALLAEMEADGHTPTQVTFGTILDACINEGAMDRAHELFNRMTKVGCEMNTILYTTLIKGFVKSKSVDKVLAVYGDMRNHDVKPDTRTFSLILKALCDAGRMEQALEFFQAMCTENVMQDEVIFNTLLSGCVVRKNLALGEKFFKDMLSLNIMPSCATFSTLMKLYTECGALPQAQALLDSMEERYRIVPELRLYMQLLHGSLRLRQRQASIDIFQSMIKTHGPPAQSEFTKTLHACISFNLFELALELMSIMLCKGGGVRGEELQALLNAAAKKRKTTIVHSVMEIAKKHKLSVKAPA